MRRVTLIQRSEHTPTAITVYRQRRKRRRFSILMMPLERAARRLIHAQIIFRQVNRDNPYTHHDALEFPDGQTVLLTDVFDDRNATVLLLRNLLLQPKPRPRNGLRRLAD
jgi:hypothetical protein